MVRNNKGGNRGKKVARKHIVGNGFNARLRTAEEEGELYACVTKLLGNGMCHVNCLEENNTSKQRLCIIRNKFRGRGKRDNQLNVGTYVLVGAREWETSRAGTLEKCDLIEVYSSSEIDKVKMQVNKNWNTIHVAAINESVDDDGTDDMFSFASENEVLREEIEQKTKEEPDDINNYLNDEDIDLDDI